MNQQITENKDYFRGGGWGGGVAQLSAVTILQQGLSEPEFYGDLVYELKKIVGTLRYEHLSYRLNSNPNAL